MNTYIGNSDLSLSHRDYIIILFHEPKQKITTTELLKVNIIWSRNLPLLSFLVTSVTKAVERPTILLSSHVNIRLRFLESGVGRK